MSNELEILQRRFDRERQARKAAEAALEQESLKLYHAGEAMRLLNRQLEGQVVEQTTARQESEARAARIIDTALDAVVAIDAAGDVIAWNKQAASVFGYSAEEALGRPLVDLVVPPRDRAAPMAGLGRLLTSDRAALFDRRVEVTAVDRGGREFAAEIAMSQLPSQAGMTYSAFVRDVSAIKQSEQRRTMMYDAARVLADAPTVDAARVQILQVVCESMGWQAGLKWDVNGDETALTFIAAWASSDDSAPLVDASRALTLEKGRGLPGRVWASGRSEWIADLATDDNFPRHVFAARAGLNSGFAFPIRIGSRTIGVMEFFSARPREPDRDLLAVFDALGRQVGQFVQRRCAEEAAEAARRAAELASAAKSEFLAKMSHEIRTPLNGIVGMIELLAGTQLDEQQRRFLDIVRGSGASLLSIINDVLDFSKIEAGHMELESVAFDPGRIAEQVVESFSPEAAKKGLEMGSVIDAPAARFVGDPGRFRQVLTNLVGNAIKFTRTGRVIVRMIGIQPSPGAPANLRLEVDDTGIGVTPDKLDRLFKSFSQADASTTRTYGGTGLGLAISKRLVELMGGAIGVHANPTGGSTFWFTLALSAAPAAHDAPAGDDSGRLSALRVIVVDDNPSGREVVTAMLARLVPQVQTADSAAAAMELLRAAAAAGRAFDVALLDTRVPGVDGWALATAIRADAALRPTRLIALSGIGQGVDHGRLVAGGFDAGLTKPLSQPRLLNAIAGAASPGDGPGAARHPADADERAPAGTRVLIAEDNEVNQFVAAKMLVSRGYVCDVVSDGRQAVERATSGEYDLVLMDCSMPEMDGFEATRLIRAHEAAGPGRPRLPIIALTAEAMNGDREKCRSVGMDDYIAKPIDPHHLFRTIRQALRAGGPVRAEALLSAPAAMPMTAPAEIDFAALLERSLGDVDFAVDTLDRFKTRAVQDVNGIERAITAGAFGEVARLAHGLKGAAAHVGARQVRDIAARIERPGTEADRARITAALSELRHAVDRSIAAIPAAVAQGTRPAATTAATATTR
ncbi:MAG TPA: response regulator [Tepidisphaeraceae bacterium]|jgi:PAS domain S-box-containing protein